MEIRLRGSAPLTILNIYAPQSARPEEEKEEFYKAAREAIKNINKTGPYLIVGDFNARLQEAANEDEEEIIGKHTFAKGQPTTWHQSN